MKFCAIDLMNELILKIYQIDSLLEATGLI